MTDQKLALALIAECRRLILEEMADRLQGKDRYTAKMIGNALSIAERDLTRGAEAEAAERAAVLGLLGDGETLESLAQAIRKGRFDSNPDAYQALVEMAERRTAISNPKALTD